MKKLRRASRSELPPAPLEFAYPLAVSGPDPAGTVIFREVPPPYAFHVLKALRLVLAWSRGPVLSKPLLRRETMEEWERRVAGLERGEEGLWAGIMTVAGQLRDPASVNPERLTQACLTILDWPVGREAHGTALLFAEAAAMAWPSNPRFAYVAGRLHRNQGRFREAEIWLERAHRVAVWNQDVELQVLSIDSLGIMRIQQGDLPGARELLETALRLARRASLRERTAEVCHDLFVAAVSAGDKQRAEHYARESFNAYGPSHPRIAKLAADVAYLWANQGHFARALQVLDALLPHFTTPDDRLRVLVCSARAAGAIGDHDAFDRAWTEAWLLLEHPEAQYLRAPATLELGLGASSLSRWEDASRSLSMARETAALTAEAETLERAEAALDRVRRHEFPDRARRPIAVSAQPADVLARDLAISLQVQATPTSGIDASGPPGAFRGHRH